jgi:hypothetical protein
VVVDRRLVALRGAGRKSPFHTSFTCFLVFVCVSAPARVSFSTRCSIADRSEKRACNREQERNHEEEEDGSNIEKSLNREQEEKDEEEEERRRNIETSLNREQEEKHEE